IDGVEDGGRLVLAVDQFEEAFTMCESEDEREAFIRSLTEAARRDAERLVVILAIRGDYYAHCAPYTEFAELLAANHVLVGPMSREELRRAVELPARRAGIRIESELVETLVDEVADEPGGLPLLSTALVEVWGARAGGREESELYRGARLSTTLDWSVEHATELNETEREFLAASRQASEREADRQRRTNRRLRGLLVGTAVFLVVALVAGALALAQR